MRNVYVPLPDDARSALARLAAQEWRLPKDQAAVLVLEGLRARGALPPEPDRAVTRRREDGGPDTAA